MTTAGSIKLIDPNATVCEWGNKRDGLGYWIKGTGWETTIKKFRYYNNEDKMDCYQSALLEIGRASCRERVSSPV